MPRAAKTKSVDENEWTEKIRSESYGTINIFLLTGRIKDRL